MKFVCTFLIIASLALTGAAQVCTLQNSGTINWNNASPPACQEGGTAAGATVLVIPAGLTVNFDDNGDTWEGVLINVYGTLNINPNGNGIVTINSSIQVKPNGRLNISSKLSLGSNTAECNFFLAVETNGLVDITGGTPERLNICGEEIARGGSSGCNSNYPNGDPPYCEPTGGFTGPTGFDKGGYNGTLPVTWLSFSVQNIDNQSVYLIWATASEKNADTFVIERSSDGKNYSPIGSRNAAGNSSTRKDYNFTDNEPVIGRTYYRIRQVDFDGSFSYSAIRHIDVSGKKAVSVFPNPIENHVVKLRLNYTTDETVHASLFDVSGLRLHDFSFHGTDHSAALNLPAGTYYIRILVGGDQFNSRIVIR